MASRFPLVMITDVVFRLYWHILNSGTAISQSYNKSFSDILVENKIGMHRYPNQERLYSDFDNYVNQNIIAKQIKNDINAMNLKLSEDITPQISSEMCLAFPDCEFVTFNNGTYFEILKNG